MLNHNLWKHSALRVPRKNRHLHRWPLPILPQGGDLCPSRCCPQSMRQYTPKPSDFLGWASCVVPTGPWSPGTRLTAFPSYPWQVCKTLIRYFISVKEDYKTMHFLLMSYAVKIISCLIFSFGVEWCIMAVSIAPPLPSLSLDSLAMALPGGCPFWAPECRRQAWDSPRNLKKGSLGFPMSGSSRHLKPV